MPEPLIIITDQLGLYAVTGQSKLKRHGRLCPPPQLTVYGTLTTRYPPSVTLSRQACNKTKKELNPHE